MAVADFRELINPAENFDRMTFDPRGGDAKFRMSNEDRAMVFQVGSRDYRVTADSYLKLGKMVGVPEAYIKRTPHHLMLPHMNYWLQNKGISSISLASDDGVIKFFSQGQNNSVSNNMIIDIVADRIGDNMNVHHVNHDFFSTNYSLTSERFEDAVDVGDAVRVGVNIKNSYANLTPLTISAYIHRLICTNGAISADNVFRLSKFSSGDEDDDKDWVIDSVWAAFDQADAEIQRLKDMKNISVTNHLTDTLHGIYNEFGVPVRARNEITDYVIDHSVNTMYDVYNAITDIASNSELASNDSDLAYRLMSTGGRLSSHTEVCRECHRVI